LSKLVWSEHGPRSGAALLASSARTPQPLINFPAPPTIMTDFHVFLSHNSKDKPLVREIAARLI